MLNIYIQILARFYSYLDVFWLIVQSGSPYLWYLPVSACFMKQQPKTRSRLEYSITCLSLSRSVTCVTGPNSSH